MIWYLLYPLRGTTEAPDLSPNNPVRVSFTRYGTYIARHVVLALLISGIVATILIYPIPYLFTHDFTNGASNLPHHVWTAAQPLGTDAQVTPDITMRSIWIHGDYMRALEPDVLTAALDLQDELLGPTERFSPFASRSTAPPTEDKWPLSTGARDAVHIVNGLTNQSWFFHSPLLYWNCSRQQILRDANLVATVNEKKTQSTPANVTLRHSIVFSGKKFSERRLLAADALVITLLHLSDSPVGRQWDHNAPLLTEKFGNKWEIYPSNGKPEKSQLYEFQFRPISLYDIISLVIAYGLTCIYFLASLSRLRAIRSKTGLTVTVMTQIAFSIMSSFTICAVLDIDLSRIPRAAYPLVVLAISLENMFRIIYAVILTPSENSSCSRVGIAFGQTAHIALASTVQNVAILVGLSRIVSPGVAGFCIFAAIATVFDFFYLSTFFLSVLSVDVRRIELEDALSKVSTTKHDHSFCETKERSPWISNVLTGKVALSTRIAGTLVMVVFVLIAQWHFFGSASVLEPIKLLLRSSNWLAHQASEASPSLEEIHQARSPGSWLRLQDHETAQEVIRAIKPSAYSYTANVYDPLVFVLRNSNRTPPPERQRLLPAAYDFINHQSAQFVISIVLVGAGLRLLASYLLWADERTEDGFSNSEDHSSLSIKTVPGGHSLDVAMVIASTDGRIVSAGLDRCIRVWDIRPHGRGYELPGTKLLDGRGLFPVLGMAIDSDSRWLAILSTTQIRLWDLAEYIWSDPVQVNAANHKPEVFCFHPKSTQAAPRVVVVRKDGSLEDIFMDGDGQQRGSPVCSRQLLMARPLIHKGTNSIRTLTILVVSKDGKVYMVKETSSGWQCESLPLNTLSDSTRHQVVPLSPHPLFLIGSACSISLVSAHDGAVQHVFATQPMLPRSVQCEFAGSRHGGSQSGIGLSSFTLGYAREGSRDCVVNSYSPAEGNEAIAAAALSGGAGGGWSTWEEAVESELRITDPGSWDLVKGKSVIGLRRKIAPRSARQGDLRRRSAVSGGSSISSVTWQVWTTGTDGHAEGEEVRNLGQDESGTEGFLVVPELGPSVKIGTRSVAFCLGNTIQIASAGSENFSADENQNGKPIPSKDGRRGRHLGSLRVPKAAD